MWPVKLLSGETVTGYWSWQSNLIFFSLPFNLILWTTALYLLQSHHSSLLPPFFRSNSFLDTLHWTRREDRPNILPLHQFPDNLMDKIFVKIHLGSFPGCSGCPIGSPSDELAWMTITASRSTLPETKITMKTKFLSLAEGLGGA